MIAEHRVGSRAMFLRVKTAPESGYKTVQLVESVRTGKAFSQRIVRRIGVARSDAELEQQCQVMTAWTLLEPMSSRHCQSIPSRAIS